MSCLPRLFCLLLACTVALSRSYVIQPAKWNFRGHPIAYETARSLPNEEGDQNSAVSESTTPAPVLLLNGFGVGSFHQHRLIHELLGDDNKYTDRAIFCIDYLGQGKSWPENCQDGEGESELGLRYCASTWIDQICGFIEQVILPQYPEGTKIHVAGNSVGGLLATFIAASRPDLVCSLSLMNVTPIWGLNLPGWSGELPVPWFPKMVGRYLFNRIRDPKTIEIYLETAYGNKEAFDLELMEQIRDCTNGPGGHAAFASILWSPPVSIAKDGHEINSFYDALESVKCDVLLLFGAADPWCKPALAKRMLQRLEKRPSTRARYVEMSEVGHCPNHEAPKSTALILDDWWSTVEGVRTSPAVDGSLCVRENWGQTVVEERKQDEIQLSLADRVALTFI